MNRPVKRAVAALGCLLACLFGWASADNSDPPPIATPKAAAPGTTKTEKKPESRDSKPPPARLDTLRKDGRSKQPATPLGLCDGS